MSVKDKLKNTWKQIRTTGETYLITPGQKQKIQNIKMRMDRNVSGAEAATVTYPKSHKSRWPKSYSDRKIK